MIPHNQNFVSRQPLNNRCQIFLVQFQAGITQIDDRIAVFNG
jgi:hypothetical protein